MSKISHALIGGEYDTIKSRRDTHDKDSLYQESFFYCLLLFHCRFSDEHLIIKVTPPLI